MLERIKKFLKMDRSNESTATVYEDINDLYTKLDSDAIQFLIGTDIVKFHEDISKNISKFRSNFSDKSGFIIPVIRITEDDKLQENQYLLKINNRVIEEKYIIPNKKEIIKEINLSINNIIKTHLEEIFSYEILENYINQIQIKNSWLIWNLTSIISIRDIREILLKILKEGKSIKNISYIFEKIYEQCLDYNNLSGYYGKINTIKISQKILEIL